MLAKLLRSVLLFFPPFVHNPSSTFAPSLPQSSVITTVRRDCKLLRMGSTLAGQELASARSCPTRTHEESQKQNQRVSFRKFAYWTADVQEDALLEAELVALAFATGIQDATSFPDYGCFASNQTGNTILLALGAAGTGRSAFHLSNVGVSLGTFILGGMLLGQVGNLCGCKRRLWLIVSSALQSAIVFAAVALQYRCGVSETGSIALWAIALLGFASGAQVAMARTVKIPEITTAMITSAYIDLVVDPGIFVLRNRSRNRRALFILALFVGAFAGTFSSANVNSPFALLLSAIIKALVTCAFMFNRCNA